jgi:hypothetical protein
MTIRERTKLITDRKLQDADDLHFERYDVDAIVVPKDCKAGG